MGQLEKIKELVEQMKNRVDGMCKDKADELGKSEEELFGKDASTEPTNEDANSEKNVVQTVSHPIKTEPPVTQAPKTERPKYYLNAGKPDAKPRAEIRAALSPSERRAIEMRRNPQSYGMDTIVPKGVAQGIELMGAGPVLGAVSRGKKGLHIGQDLWKGLKNTGDVAYRFGKTAATHPLKTGAGIALGAAGIGGGYALSHPENLQELGLTPYTPKERQDTVYADEKNHKEYRRSQIELAKKLQAELREHPDDEQLRADFRRAVYNGTNTTGKVSANESEATGDPDLDINLDAYMPEPPKHYVTHNGVENVDASNANVKVQSQGGLPAGMKPWSNVAKEFITDHPYLTAAVVMAPFLATPLYKLAKSIFSKGKKKDTDESIEDNASEFDSYLSIIGECSNVNEDDEAKSEENKGIVDSAKELGQKALGKTSELAKPVTDKIAQGGEWIKSKADAMDDGMMKTATSAVGNFAAEHPLGTLGIAAAAPLALWGASKLFGGNDDDDESVEDNDALKKSGKPINEDDINIDDIRAEHKRQKAIDQFLNDQMDSDDGYSRQKSVNLKKAKKEIEGGIEDNGGQLLDTLKLIGIGAGAVGLHKLTKDIWNSHPAMKRIADTNPSTPKNEGVNEGVFDNNAVTTGVGAMLGGAIGGPVGAIGGAALGNHLTNSINRRTTEKQLRQAEKDLEAKKASGKEVTDADVDAVEDLRRKTKGDGYTAPLVGAAIGSLIGGPAGGIVGAGLGAGVGALGAKAYNKYRDYRSAKNYEKELGRLRAQNDGAVSQEVRNQISKLRIERRNGLPVRGKSGRYEKGKDKLVLVSADESVETNEGILSDVAAFVPIAGMIAGNAIAPGMVGTSVGSALGSVVARKLAEKDAEMENEKAKEDAEKDESTESGKESAEAPNEIVKVLMERDGMSYDDAWKLYKDVMDEVYELIGNGDTDAAEETFTSNLGLEPDYLINALI